MVVEQMGERNKAMTIRINALLMWSRGRAPPGYAQRSTGSLCHREQEIELRRNVK